MKDIRSAFSGLICCLGSVPSDDCPSQAPIDVLAKHPSTLSAHMLPSAVPRTTIAKQRNVNEISLPRYQHKRGLPTAQEPFASTLEPMSIQRQPSLDVNFQFGEKELEKKDHTRLGQLGSHIRQKLSEGRLSKSSSRRLVNFDATVDQPEANTDTVDGASRISLATSHRSVGLIELLKSQTGSEAGYDSDAKSIQITVLQAQDGVKSASPPVAERLIPTMKKPSSVRAESLDSFHHKESTATCSMPDHSHSASIPAAPSPSSFKAAVLAEKDTSPILTLQKLSVGLAKGILTLPEFPNPNACGRERITETDTQNLEFLDVVKRLSNTAAAAKRDSQMSYSSTPRDSLISNIDLGLLDYISKFTELGDEAATPGIPACEHASPEMPTTSVDIATTKPTNQIQEDSLTHQTRSFTDPDQTSIHLYNMRISQNLASPSLIAITSRPTTSYASTVTRPLHGSLESTNQKPQGYRQRQSSQRIIVEHNRRPSDPQTRRLFEVDSKVAGLPSRRKTMASTRSETSYLSRYPMSATDDASSFYWSDGELASSDYATTGKPKRNTNSIAIGGRSGSIHLPVSSPDGFKPQSTKREEAVWFGKKHSSRVSREGYQGPPESQRSRSVTSLDTSGSQEHSPTNNRKRRYRTEDNERWSDMDMNTSTNIGTKVVTETSAQGLQEVKNEQMSEITASASVLSKPELTFHPATSGIAKNELSRKSYKPTLEARTRWQQRRSRSASTRGEEASAEPVAEMWQRTFQQATKETLENPFGGLLQAPKYDRNGRRRSSGASSKVEIDANLISDATNNRNTASTPIDGRKKALSVSPDEGHPSQGIETQQLDSTEKRKHSQRAKSLLDLGRRFTMAAIKPLDGKGSDSHTPSKENFGLWARFPSHTRHERPESAGELDGVVTRDFVYEGHSNSSPFQPSPLLRPLNIEVATPGTWRKLTFRKSERLGRMKSNSMTLPRISKDPASSGRSKKTAQKQKGLVSRWKRLYRTNSLEIKAYTQTYGHRSSISVGGSLEYPELECIPGIGHPSEFDLWGRMDIDGTNETAHRHHREAAKQSPKGLKQSPPPLDSQPWTQMYRSCVGSLSALKSDVEIGSTMNQTTQDAVQDTGKRDIMSESTSSFVIKLEKSKEEAKLKLFEQVERLEPPAVEVIRGQ